MLLNHYEVTPLTNLATAQNSLNLALIYFKNNIIFFQIMLTLVSTVQCPRTKVGVQVREGLQGRGKLKVVSEIASI